MPDGPVRLSLTERRSPDAIIEVDGVDYPVRTRLLIPEMSELLDVELAMDSATNHRDVVSALSSAYALVMRAIRERTPDAPDLPLDPNEVGLLMRLIAGRGVEVASVKAEVIDGLTAGETEPEKAVEKIDAAIAGDENEDGDPLPSRKSSRKASSGSGKRSAGRRASGANSPGTTSVSTEHLAPVG